MNSSVVMFNRLAIGTVQFGLDYGVANKSGRVDTEAGRKILCEAYKAGVNTLDTAIAYGDSELTLGEIGLGAWSIVSKLPEMPHDVRDVDGWVEGQITNSLRRLRVGQLYGMLLHHPRQIYVGNGRQLAASLQRAKERGLVKKIGASIYTPAELGPLFDACAIDLIQAPLNILDRRLIDSGWLLQMAQMGVEVHVRSIFLQGLLLMTEGQRPAKFMRWRALWTLWDSWLRENGLTGLEACLRFALHEKNVGKIVVGVDGLNQLQQILSVPGGQLPEVPDFSGLYDEKLINPSCWSQL